MHLSRNEPEARPIVSFKEKRNKVLLCHLGQFLRQFWLLSQNCDFFFRILEKKKRKRRPLFFFPVALILLHISLSHKFPVFSELDTSDSSNWVQRRVNMQVKS